MKRTMIEVDFKKGVRIIPTEPVRIYPDLARQEINTSLRSELKKIINSEKIERMEDFLASTGAMMGLIFEIRTFLDAHPGYGEALFGSLEDEPLGEAIAIFAKEMVREYFN